MKKFSAFSLSFLLLTAASVFAVKNGENEISDEKNERTSSLTLKEPNASISQKNFFEQDETGRTYMVDQDARKYSHTLGTVTYPIKDFFILRHVFFKQFHVTLSPFEEYQEKHKNAIARTFEDYLLDLQEPQHSAHYQAAGFRASIALGQQRVAFSTFSISSYFTSFYSFFDKQKGEGLDVQVPKGIEEEVALYLTVLEVIQKRDLHRRIQ